MMSNEALLTAEPRLLLAALVLYAVATGCAIGGALLPNDRLASAGRRVALVALVVHGVSIAMRWAAVGHGPYLTRYEVLSANAWVAMALFLFVSWRRPALRPLAVLVFPAALLLVGFGLYGGSEVAMLPPTFRGVWLVLHVSFYFIAFATALMAVSASLAYVWRARSPKPWMDRLPPGDTLDEWAHRAAGLAFAFWGVGMLTGAIWADYAWGRYWAWDPIETWSLGAWVMYALYLHLTTTMGWKGKRAAWLAVIAFPVILFSLLGVPIVFNSIHGAYLKF